MVLGILRTGRIDRAILGSSKLMIAISELMAYFIIEQNSMSS